ncbi:AmmeMemoRadiSam system protein B [Vibrio sp. CAU 1672]|uniref:AmmeMemoRadiSam system protein B n=1 Tax=Vibrio sp. CAU 1672 TaxID=3032594 RepID=UPI0023D9B0E9|nr:AmmeMemoRadiSam system protein B [Vibrio sp. CAU 1672]MDF2155863.1 AmmeMemoRadiSam system protein B [Vibrio sp. CAU 1672]
MRYRNPAVAGRFYSANKHELGHQIANMMAGPPLLSHAPNALVVPHAGYFYSGKVAASAYTLIKNRITPPRKVVLLGPCHHMALNGCAVSHADFFKTPLGDVELDRQAAGRLVESGLAAYSDEAHHWEHSLEVQLPFLQFALAEFSLLPIVVGKCSAEDVAKLISVAAADEHSLIVVSTDLSHYHPYPEAVALDRATCDEVLNFVPAIPGQRACGSYALNGLLKYAKDLFWRCRLVEYCNSGDVMAREEEREPDPTDTVVGYASFIFY